MHGWLPLHTIPCNHSSLQHVQLCAALQPPRVRLRLWRYDAVRPTALLAVLGSEEAGGNLRLQISDAVLCSGAVGAVGGGWGG